MIRIKSFDGVSLDTAEFLSHFVATTEAVGRSVTPVILPVIGGYPRDEGFDHNAKTFQIAVLITSETLAATVETLKFVFRAGHAAALVADFDGTDRVRDVRVEAVFPYAGAPSRFIVSLIAADPRWRSPAVLTETGSLTASGQGITVNNPGNAIEDRAIIRLTPTANKTAATSQLYRKYAIMANRAKRALLDHPIDVGNALFDHAALVTALKSHSTGRDIRVLQNGREIPRFFGEHANTDAGSATLGIWSHIVWSGMREAHLLAAITSVAPANGGELEVQTGEPWKDEPGRIVNPTSGEVISFRGWTPKNASGNAAFTGIKRARWGTTAASGSAGDQLLRAQHQVETVYGQTSNLDAPEARPDVKPMLNLASATLTNARWEWINFYDDTYPNRPGQWYRTRELRDSQAHLIVMPNGSPAAIAQFEYQERGFKTGYQAFNVLRRPFPTGTGADGSGDMLGLTRVVNDTMHLYALGIDDDGNEITLLNAPGNLASGAVAVDDLGSMYELMLYGRSLIMCSSPSTPPGLTSFLSSVAINVASAVGEKYQKVVIPATSPNPTMLLGVFVYVGAVDTGLGNPNLGITLHWDDSGTPLDTPNMATLGTISGASLATDGWKFIPVPAGALFVEPGQTIYIKCSVSTTADNAVYWGALSSSYQGEAPVKMFRLLGTGDIETNARAENGDIATVDGVGVPLNTTNTPYFALSPELDCYWLNGTLVNETTEQELTFNIYTTTDHVIEIDIGNRIVRDLETGEESLFSFVRASDEEALFSFPPGDTSVRWDEVGCAGMNIEVEYYGRYE